MDDQQRPMGDQGVQDSLMPVQSHRLSVEAEASLMNQGRGRQLLGIAAAAVLIGGLAVLTLRHIGRTQSYLSSAAAAANIEETQFEGYFLCVLPGATASQLTSATRVHTLFERAGDVLGKKHGKTLQSCSPRLSQLQAEVDRLTVPASISGERTELKEAAAQLAAAHAGYMRYLDDPGGPYEFAKATALIEKIGRAFARYRRASTALRKKLNDAA